MEQPYPLEFVKKGDTILLRLEEYDTVRTIVMTPDAKFAALPKTLLGRSKGRWEGETLVVTTDRIDWAYIDPSGIPQGGSSSIVERFTPTPDGTRLSYTMTITDPATFTAPLELKEAAVRQRRRPLACALQRDVVRRPAHHEGGRRECAQRRPPIPFAERPQCEAIDAPHLVGKGLGRTRAEVAAAPVGCSTVHKGGLEKEIVIGPTRRGVAGVGESRRAQLEQPTLRDAVAPPLSVRFG